MLEILHTLLSSVSDKDVSDYYPNFFQIIPILLKEIGILNDKQSKTEKFFVINVFCGLFIFFRANLSPNMRIFVKYLLMKLNFLFGFL